MDHRHSTSTIAVNDAASRVPIGPRRFRQLAGLETEDGKTALGLRYVNGVAHIDRTRALEVVQRLQEDRQKSTFLPQQNLKRFTERNLRDAGSNARVCLEDGCGEHARGRSKLCSHHSHLRAERRAAAGGRRRVPLEPC